MNEEKWMILWDLYVSQSTARLRYRSSGPHTEKEAKTLVRGMYLAGNKDALIVPIEHREEEKDA